MSFILSSDTETFCDWRVSLPPTCSSHSFFYGVQAFSVASVSLQLALVFTCLCLKKFGMKEPWGNFRFGALGAQVVLFFAFLAWIIQGLIVLLAEHPLAGQITWAFIIPLPLFPVVFFLSTLLESFPSIFVSKNQSAIGSLLNSATLCKSVVIIFTLFLWLANVALHVASTQLRKANEISLANHVAQAAAILFAVNATVFLLLFVFVSRMFVKVIAKCMEAIEGDQMAAPEDLEAREKSAIMVLVTKKIRSNIVVSSFDTVLLIVYHLLLAFYPEFFSNLAFSKAMAVIFVALLPTATLPLMFMHLYIDVKRVMHIQGTQHSKASRSAGTREKDKDPLSVALDDLQKDPSLPLEPPRSSFPSEESLDSFPDGQEEGRV